MTSPAYLYTRGPWPQPAPGFSNTAAPAVLHIPKAEKDHWDDHVGSRYKRQIILETPLAAVWAMEHTGVKLVDDARFTAILADGIFSKFLTPTLDEDDLARFEARVPGVRTGTWFKTDYSVVRFIQPRDGVSVAPTAVLWRSSARFQYEPVAIAVGDVVFLPGDGEGWKLAKCFALQAAGIATTLYMHPMLHFPTDCMNAIVKTLLPIGHVIQQLYLPHFELAMCVDDAVLHDRDTVLEQGKVYAPYPGDIDDHLQIVATLFRGMDHPSGRPNAAFPPYRFRIGPRVVHSRYGEFLARYYDTIYRFGLEVAAELSPTDPLRAEFARHMAFWLPGFPEPDEFAKPDVFAGVFATVVSDVAIGHTADHYLYGRVDIQEVPFRLRTPVPTSTRVAPFDPGALTDWKDALNYRMCMKLFFEPYPVSFLKDVDYGFGAPALVQANADFRAALAATEQKLEIDGIPNYIPLASIAPSVQF